MPQGVDKVAALKRSLAEHFLFALFPSTKLVHMEEFLSRHETAY